MIYKTLNTTANQALNGSTALHMVALQKGAKTLRVHDVKEAMECIQLHRGASKIAFILYLLYLLKFSDQVDIFKDLLNFNILDYHRHYFSRIFAVLCL